ncbi:MAG TPA: TIGR02266 family protein [Kofleriaceae bacterium]|nr:TIGR02266 family protein [Kofleriaceae bacterium]
MLADGRDAPAPGEKRRHARAEVTLLVEYADADDLVGDYTDNLSSGGTFVATGRTLAEGTRVRLALSFPGLLETIHVDGEVRWTRGAGEAGADVGVGIEFLEGEGRDRLHAIIERVRSRDPRLIAPLVRVLVVEDNPHVAEMVRAGLAGIGRRGGEMAFAVETAANGHEALELLRRRPFDAAIIDIYLPVIDGTHVIQTLRRELALTLPVIAVSAGGPSVRALALEAGADMFIDKPMRLRHVIETIQSLMKR